MIATAHLLHIVRFHERIHLKPCLAHSKCQPLSAVITTAIKADRQREETQTGRGGEYLVISPLKSGVMELQEKEGGENTL